MPRVAFVTCEQFPELGADDQLAAAALRARSIDVVPWIWTDATVPVVDLVVVRTPWDWPSWPTRFDEFLAQLERGTTKFENRAARRYQDKRYLPSLAANGARIPPCVFVEPGESAEAALRATGWDEVVMKPTLSAGARRTVRFAAHDFESHRALADEILSDGSLLIQPFLREIVDDGEWSLVFFDGEYSHALKKHPAADDFRVQDDLGGSVHPAIAPPAVIDEARRGLLASGEQFLFARVDGVASPRLGGFVVTELEVVEPELFFRVDPHAADRFATAVERRLTAAHG